LQRGRSPGLLVHGAPPNRTAFSPAELTLSAQLKRFKIRHCKRRVMLPV
jgi:hypothetical protein